MFKAQIPALLRTLGVLLALPTLPSPTLAVPDGNQLAFHFAASGVQIYTCKSAATGFTWTFDAPEAALTDRSHHVVVKHYAGPTWESVDDRSAVVASKLAAFSASPKAIPELLLQASTHVGKGLLSDVIYIQWLETTGGLAPSNGCDASHVGDTARVDYTASYFFYKAK